MGCRDYCISSYSLSFILFKPEGEITISELDGNDIFFDKIHRLFCDAVLSVGMFLALLC
jgi:hypothetical protein